jgi:hypothetical protein
VISAAVFGIERSRDATVSSYLPAVFGLIGTIVGATISAYFTYVNSNVSRRTKQADLYRMIKAELLNLSRHCRITADELQAIEDIGTSRLRMSRYRDGGFMALDTKELYLLNENLCQDMMQIVLHARNTDIEIDHMLESIKTGKRESYRPGECAHLVARMRLTVRIAEIVLEHLKKHERRPERYNEPRINW